MLFHLQGETEKAVRESHDNLDFFTHNLKARVKMLFEVFMVLVLVLARDLVPNESRRSTYSLSTFLRYNQLFYF